MKLTLNQSLDAFDRESDHAYPFATHNNNTTQERILFFPDERLLYVPTLMTTFATGLAGVFVALLIITLITRNHSYFQPEGVDNSGADFTLVPLIVFSVLLVVTIVVVFIARRNLARRKQYLQEATNLKNGYKEGLYFLEEGLIVRTANRVDAVPYDRIRFVRRLARKHIIGKNVYLPEIHYFDESGIERTLNIASKFYGDQETSIWEHLQQRGVEVHHER